jgi:hypothetical protein
MRLHIWEYDKPAIMGEYVIHPDCTATIIDYPHWDAYEVGDQIQFITDLGTTVYFVTDVVPEWDGEREMHLVTICESGWTTQAGH